MFFSCASFAVVPHSQRCVKVALETVASDRGEVSSLLSLLARSRLVALQIERQWTAREGPELTGDALLLLL